MNELKWKRFSHYPPPSPTPLSSRGTHPLIQQIIQPSPTPTHTHPLSTTESRVNCKAEGWNQTTLEVGVRSDGNFRWRSCMVTPTYLQVLLMYSFSVEKLNFLTPTGTELSCIAFFRRRQTNSERPLIWKNVCGTSVYGCPTGYNFRLDNNMLYEYILHVQGFNLSLRIFVNADVPHKP